MKSWLLKREYQELITGCKMKKLNFLDNKKKSERNDEKRAPFVITYDPNLKV